MKNFDIEKTKAYIAFPDQVQEMYLKLECCKIEVGDWYKYCPKCGKKIELEKCEKKNGLPGTGLFELFDYAIWNCSCGDGYERYEYNYCPICGRKRIEK